jgi:plasmid replication initiation protein
MSDKMTIYKHIDFVLAKNIWGGLEGKLIAILVKELELDKNNNFQEFKEQTISIKELEKIFNVKKMNTTQIKHIIDKLVGKAIFINSIDEETKRKKYTGMAFFSKLEYIDGQSYIKFEFNYAMKPYLLNFKKNFVKYHIKNIVQFKNKYSLGFYELCRNNRNFKDEKYLNLEMSLKNIHTWLDTPNSYKIYDNLKNKVLEAICYDITMFSDIAITYKAIKQGKKVIAIKFVYQENLKKENRKRYWELLAIMRSWQYRKDKKLSNEIKKAIQTLRKKDNINFKELDLKSSFKKI